MKVTIVKDIDKLRVLARKPVYESFLVGYWDGDECVIVKDRYSGHINRRLNSVELVNYIDEMQTFFSKDELF
jgi:hypothetical protein